MRTPALLSALALALSPLTPGAPAVAAVPVPAGVASADRAGVASADRAGVASADPAGVASADRAGWGWPLSPKPPVLRAFDPPERPWLSGHRGVDLGAGSPAAAVIAPASGTVSFVGVVVDRPVLTIDHGGGVRSSFEPVQSDLVRGSPVAAGSRLGHLVPGHCGPAPCLHWGVRRGDDYINPLAFVMDLRPSVLLPPLDPPPG